MEREREIETFYNQEILNKESNRKCIFSINLKKVNMLQLKEINGLYKDEEERLQVTGGNLVDSALNIIGTMFLDLMTKLLANGDPTSEGVMTKLLRTGKFDVRWPPFDGSQGIDLIYLGTADKDTESILLENCTKILERTREGFTGAFKDCFEELKEKGEDDKLVVTPVRVDTDGKAQLDVKLGFDFTKVTAEKLQRLFDTTPEEVLSSVLLHCGGDLSPNPIDLLLVTLSQVVEVLIVHGEREPWKFLEETPPWGWPAFDKEFGLYVFEVSSNVPGTTPQVTTKNFNHLIKASLGLAETSNLY